MKHAISSRNKPLLFLDYEGTLGTSVERHYIQYVEALSRLQTKLKGRLDAGAAEILAPLARETFLERYATAKRIGALLPFEDPKRPEASVLQALIEQLHSEIIWEYRPEHMEHERVLPGVRENLSALVPSFHCVVVSYTRQVREDFAAHLERLGLVSSTLLHPDDIITVGADGAKSREAKAAAIRNGFGAQIQAHHEAGVLPLLIGDATDDMAAAFDCGLAFIGVCKTGKANRRDFEAALEREQRARRTLLHAAFIDSLGSSELLPSLTTFAGGS